MVLQTQIIIAGNTFSTGFIFSYRLLVKSTTNGDNGVIVINKKIDDTFTIKQLQTVVVKRGNGAEDTYTIFQGRIINIKDIGAAYEITVRGKLQDLSDDIFTKTFDIDDDSEVGVISEIMNTIITDGGLSATIADSGVAAVLKKFIIRNQTRLNRVKELAKTLSWELYYDSQTDTVISGPAGNDTYSTVLEIGANVINSPQWLNDGTRQINKFIIEGQEQLFTTQETFDGTGAQTEYTLAFKPSDRGNFIITVGGTEQTGGITDSTASPDYTVDSEKAVVTFTVAPGSGTGNIVMNYAYLQPITVIGQDYDSTTEYGHVRAKHINRRDITTVADADKLLTALLETYATPERKAVLLMFNVNDIRPGVLVEVLDTLNGVSGEFLVSQIVYTYPEGVDEVHVGSRRIDQDDIMTNIQDRVELLERENKNTDIVNTLVPAQEFVDVKNVFELHQITPLAGVSGHATLPTGLECYYSLDEDVTDVLGNHNGTNQGGVLEGGASGISGRAYSFAGSEYVDTNYTPSGVSALSVNVWGKFTDKTQFRELVRNADDGFGNDRFGIYINQTTGYVSFNVTGSNQSNSIFTGSVDLADGAYHMYTLTWDGVTMTSYVDGVNLDERGAGGVLVFGQAFYIGAVNFGGAQLNPWKGDIDEVGFWTKELTQAEVTDLYNSGNGLSYLPSLYWNDTSNGAWDDNAWLKEGAETETVTRRVHPSNKYYEDFRDNDLVDTTNTTATVNTSTHNIAFTDTQVFQSEVVFLDNTSYNKARWFIEAAQITTVGNLSFSVSADGGTTFQSITINQSGFTNLTTSTTGGIVLKIVASGVASISFDDSYNKSVPWRVEAQ